jgi:predicted transcriptional regulator
MQSNEDHLSKSLDTQIQSDSDEYAKILDSSLKVRALMMLLIYPELTLTQLSEKLGKVKSTISKHMEELVSLGLVQRRLRKYRSDKKQHIFSHVKKFGYRGKTFEDLKNTKPEKLHSYMQEEFLINRRLFSYIQEVNQQILLFISDFYKKCEPKDYTEDFMNNIYRYNTCVPRLKFMTKEEYIEYRKEFLKFDDKFIERMEEKRLKEPNNKPKEYLAIHELLPIRQVLDHVLSHKNQDNDA